MDPARPTDPAEERKPRWGRRLAGVLIFSALGLFWATENPWQSAFAGRPLGSPFGRVLFYWLVHWWTWAGFALVVARLARRYPLTRGRLANWGVHLVAAVALGSIQLVAMRLVISTVMSWFTPVGELRESLLHDFQIFAHKNLLTYVAIVAATYGLDALRRAKEHEVRTARLAEQLARAELATLRMQLHPHFLFNSLHTAAELVHENPALAEKTLLRLAELLRRALRVSAREEESLAESLEFVDGYLELESVRLEGRLQVVYEVPESLLAVRVPTLLLQPLAENAVRHGVARRREHGVVTIAARAVGDELELAVSNDLPTSDRAPLHSGAGIGLANVRSRLAHLFADAASLAAGVEGGRYVARIRLPLELAPQASPAGGPLALPTEVTT